MELHTVYVDKLSKSKTVRTKRGSGSPFKNWNVHLKSELGDLDVQCSRSVWNSIRDDNWYDMIFDQSKRHVGGPYWIVAAVENGCRKKLLLFQTLGIPLELAAIILTYAFPKRAEPKLIRK